MKKVSYFIGAGLVIGGIAAIAVYLLNSKKNKECESSNDSKGPDEERTPVDKETLTEAAITRYEDVKSSAIESIYSGHEIAAAIMSDSVETIRENVKASERTNDEIDAVSAELDKMLRED